MGTDWKKISKEELEKLYIKYQSAPDIGKLFGINSTSVYRKMKLFGIHTKKPINSKPNIEGQNFGYYLVLNKSFFKKASWYFECKCSGCNRNNIVKAWDLINGRSKSCKSCCLKQGQTAGKNSKCWKGYKDISLWFFNKFKLNAFKRHIQFNITIKEAWEIFEKQKGKCAISGLQLKLPKRSNNQGTLECTASIDRLDSSKSYTKDNIHWVHKHINIMKGAIELKAFINYCRLISEFNESQEFDSDYIKNIENYANNTFLKQIKKYKLGYINK
jgi:hypothetical protein